MPASLILVMVGHVHSKLSPTITLCFGALSSAATGVGGIIKEMKMGARPIAR